MYCYYNIKYEKDKTVYKPSIACILFKECKNISILKQNFVTKIKNYILQYAGSVAAVQFHTRTSCWFSSLYLTVLVSYQPLVLGKKLIFWGLLRPAYFLIKKAWQVLR